MTRRKISIDDFLPWEIAVNQNVRTEKLNDTNRCFHPLEESIAPPLALSLSLSPASLKRITRLSNYYKTTRGGGGGGGGIEK